MFVEPCQISLDSIVASKRSCVCIDDAGTPGQIAGSTYLHPDRKSWVAVLATPSQAAEMRQQLPGVLDELRALTGATELHFTEIYRGSGQFKGVDLRVRLAIFDFMRHIFISQMFPVIVQTLDPRSLAELRARQTFPDEIGPFSMRVPGDAALFLLLMQVKWHLQKNPEFGQQPAYVVIDEGFRPANRRIILPGQEGCFAESSVFTATSHDFHPLQVSDFAAFCIARTQWLLTKPARSKTDDAFLAILKDIRINTVNLPEQVVDLSNWSPQKYEELIDADRRAKGLQPLSE